MDQSSQATRIGQANRVRELLAEHLENMVQFVEHHRKVGPEVGHLQDREIVQCTLVIEWKETDGSEYVTVAGDADLTELGIKGMLHDGIYAMAHRNDPDYVIPK